MVGLVCPFSFGPPPKESEQKRILKDIPRSPKVEGILPLELHLEGLEIKLGFPFSPGVSWEEVFVRFIGWLNMLGSVGSSS